MPAGMLPRTMRIKLWIADHLYSCEELAAVDPVLDEMARETLARSEWE